MHIIDIPLHLLHEAPWNPNVADAGLLAKLRRSIERFGVIENLVVRPLGDAYEVLSGNQRLEVYRGLGAAAAPCVVVEVDDAQAKLLAQVLNRTRGEDDLGLKGSLMRDLADTLGPETVIALLPETQESLAALSNLGQVDMAEHLEAWQRAQAARLRHLQFQLTPAQLEVIENALARLMDAAREARGSSPNVRGTALYLLCRDFLDREDRS